LLLRPFATEKAWRGFSNHRGPSPATLPLRPASIRVHTLLHNACHAALVDGQPERGSEPRVISSRVESLLMVPVLTAP